MTCAGSPRLIRKLAPTEEGADMMVSPEVETTEAVEGLTPSKSRSSPRTRGDQRIIQSPDKLNKIIRIKYWLLEPVNRKVRSPILRICALGRAPRRFRLFARKKAARRRLSSSQ